MAFTEEQCPQCHRDWLVQSPLVPAAVHLKGAEIDPLHDKVKCIQDEVQRLQTEIQAIHSDFHSEVQRLFDSLNNKTRSLATLAEKLKTERVPLLQKLNEIQPTISVLPREILALVFQYTCPPHDFDPIYDLKKLPNPSKGSYPQFILAGVSGHWRQLVFASPRIWTSLDLSLTQDVYLKRSNILRCFLTYSGHCPLSFYLRFVMYNNINHLVHGEIDHLFYEHAWRFRELYLLYPPRKWVKFLPQLSNLVNISIHCHDVGDPVLIPNSCSRITIFDLPRAVVLELSYLDVTVLSLLYVPVDVATSLLVQCPNLVRYRCRLASSPNSRDPSKLPQHPFTLPHLTTFEWETSEWPDADGAVCRLLQMPVLQTLCWRGSQGGWGILYPESYSESASCLHHLPSTVSALLLSHIMMDREYQTALHYLHDNPIECLVISFSSVSAVLQILKYLTPSDDQSARLRFPKLGTLIFDQCDDGDIRLTTELVDMVEKRFLNGMNGPFTLEIRDSELWYHTDVMDKLQGLVDRGFDLRLTESTELDDWLV